MVKALASVMRTVYVLRAAAAAGADPEIAPVLELIVKPVGSAGVIEYVNGVYSDPPPTTGVNGVIAGRAAL